MLEDDADQPDQARRVMMFGPLGRMIGSTFARLGRVDTTSYIPELDGLRCLAIMLVLVWHASLRAARYIDHAYPGTPNFYRFFPHGEIGVALFFFVSGFVVSQPFLSRPRAKWRIGQFAKRRFLRIYPPYLIVMLMCYAALAIVGHAPADAYAFQQSTIGLRASFLASLVYLHGVIFNAPPRLNPPMWSLEIEVVFYMVLPFFMYAYCSFERGKRALWLCVGIALVILISSFLFDSRSVDLRLRFGFFGHAFLFLLGIATADVAGDQALRIQTRIVAGDLIFLSGFALLAVVGLFMTKNDARMIDEAYALATQSAIVIAILLMFHGAFRGVLAGLILNLSLVRLVGTMCYSIYLTHVMVMTAVGEGLGSIFHSHDTVLIYAVFLTVLTAASLIFGTVFYALVERPIALYLAAPRVRNPDIRTYLPRPSDKSGRR